MPDLVVPALGESITEAIVAKWLKKPGDAVAADEPVVDLETDKVSVQLPSPTAGVLTEQKFAEGTTVKVGQVIGSIQAGAAAAKPAPAPKAAAPAPAPVAAAPPAPAPAPVASAPAVAAAPDHLTPSQRKHYRETGTLPNGNGNGATAGAPTAASFERAPVRDDEELVAMTPLRRTIAERLVQAQHTAAMLTTFNEVDLSHVMALRTRFQDEFTKKHGVKLGFMSFFARAVVESLKAYPGLNAELRGTDIIYKKHYDIGIAVGSGKGLVVPVIRAVDTLSFADIEKKIAELGTRARDNKLTLPELQGGTFTITNGGIYGSMMSTPILNFPQTGILGMHNIIKRPIVVDDQIVIRPMMYIAMSYDHRVVDGREAVQFLVGVKERLENPERLLLSL